MREPVNLLLTIKYKPDAQTSESATANVHSLALRTAQPITYAFGSPLNAIPFKTHQPLSPMLTTVPRSQAAQNRTLIRRGGAADRIAQSLNGIALNHGATNQVNWIPH